MANHMMGVWYLMMNVSEMNRSGHSFSEVINEFACPFCCRKRSHGSPKNRIPVKEAAEAEALVSAA